MVGGKIRRELFGCLVIKKFQFKKRKLQRRLKQVKRYECGERQAKKRRELMASKNRFFEEDEKQNK